MDERHCQSNLCDLPVELLTMICEHSVLEIEAIELTPDLEQPALTRVCRCFRTLALPIWYTNNFFIHEFQNFDRSLGIQFARVPESKGFDVEYRILADPLPPDAMFNESVAFANLMAWAKAHYERGENFKYKTEFIGRRRRTTEDGLDWSMSPLALVFTFLHEHWRAEWLAAGKDRRKMARWETRTPVVDAGLKMVNLYQLCLCF